MPLSTASRGLLASLSDELAEAVRRAGRSLVAVRGRRRYPASGIVWQAGQVVTAAHVLERDVELSVTTPDGAPHPARIVGVDAGSDLAVLAVPEVAGVPPFELAPADQLAAGHLALAVGRPGTPEPVASFGAITSLGSAWRTATGGVLDAYVRADVALLPGVSGGALVDVQGRLLGMLSAHLAGGDPMAIPTATLGPLVQRIASGGTLRRAYLGVSSQPVVLQESLRRQLGLDQSGGLMLLGLEPGAPAERAGLLIGDILLALGERVVEDGEALQMALGPQAIDAPLPVRLLRGGTLRELVVTPAPRPS